MRGNLLSFLGGALVASAIAFLFLTEDGATLRKKIKQKFEDNGIKLSNEELEAVIQKIKDELKNKEGRNSEAKPEPDTDAAN